MRSLPRSMLVLASLSALACTGAAATGLQAVFATQSLDWTASGSSGADLVAVEIAVGISADNPLPATAPAAPVNNSFFQIIARAVEVDTDQADVFVAGGVVKGPLVPNTPASPSPVIHSSHEAYSAVTVTGQASREGRFLMVFPLSTLSQVSIPCGDAAATDQAQVFAQSIMATREDKSADVRAATRITPCATSNVTLHGDFLVVLWEWDGMISAAEGSASFWSGKHALDQADARPFATQAREVYLTAYDADLVVPGNAERPPRVFTNSLHLDTASNMTLHGANGEVAAKLPASGSTVELTGAMNVQFQRSANDIGVHVQDGLGTVQVDGKPLSLEGVVASPPSGLPSASLATLVAIVAFVGSGGGVLVYRQRHRRPVSRPDRQLVGPGTDRRDAIEALLQNDAGAAVPMARRQAAEAPDDCESQFPASRGLRRAGYGAEARPLLQRAPLLAAADTQSTQVRLIIELEAAEALYDESLVADGEQRFKLHDLAAECLRSAAKADPAVLAHPAPNTPRLRPFL